MRRDQREKSLLFLRSTDALFRSSFKLFQLTLRNAVDKMSKWLSELGNDHVKSNYVEKKSAANDTAARGNFAK